MSWYSIDRVSFLVPGTFRQDHFDGRDVTRSIGPWIVDRQSISISVALARHPQIRIDLRLDQELD